MLEGDVDGCKLGPVDCVHTRGLLVVTFLRAADWYGLLCPVEPGICWYVDSSPNARECVFAVSQHTAIGVDEFAPVVSERGRCGERS